MTSTYPDSPACLRNQQPILEVIQPILKSARQVLEIGSGTGQHAVYFARAMPELVWQTSDRPDYHPAIRDRLSGARLDNVISPILLDVLDPWPEDLHCDAIFTANTLHIMSWPAVLATFAGAGALLEPGAPMITYGPFSVNGIHTAPSNEQFDRSLRMQDPDMGIRDVDALKGVALESNFRLEQDVAMPANNRTLIWRKN